MFASGIFAKDARTRIKNGQIEINGDKVKEDIEIDINMLKTEPDIVDAGTFICEHIIPNDMWRLRCNLTDMHALWCIDNDLSIFFSDFLLIKISKKQLFVIRKNIN